MNLTPVITAAIAVVSLSCNRGSDPTPPPDPTATKMATADPAVGVANVIKHDVLITAGCSSADFTWATCVDENTRGFDALKKCTDDAAKACRAAKAMFSTPTSKDACGQEIEKKTRAYVDERLKFFEAYAAWLETKRAVLGPAMAKKTKSDACDGHDAWCNGEPIADPGSYAQINNIECVKSLFTCDPPSGNVCLLPKIACRLNIGADPDCKPGPVASKATGLAIH